MITLSDHARDAAVAGVLRLIDAGGKPGHMRLFSASGTMIADFGLEFPAFDSPENGSARARGLPLAAVALPAAGDGSDAAWYEVTDAAGTRVLLGTVSRADGDGDLRLDNVTLARGQVITLMDWRHEQG